VRSLAGAGSVQSSHSAPSADNLTGFSATLAELEGYLGGENSDGADWLEPDSLDEETIKRGKWLCEAVEGWGNSRIAIDAKSEWQSDPSTCARIHLASHACNAVRPKQSPAPSVPPGFNSFQIVRTLGAIPLDVKSTSFFTAATKPLPGADVETVLIVAVRAQGGIADRIVAANSALDDVDTTLINTSAFTPGVETSTNTQCQLRAHHGFLNAMRNALPRVVAELEEVIRASTSSSKVISRILFTGHSAGGAVANLFFAHFLTCAHKYGFLKPDPDGVPQVPLSCITFGAPPILSQNITPGLKSCLIKSSEHNLQPTEFLMFAIEGDPVIRLDIEYASFLLEICRETFRTFRSSSRSVPPTLPQKNPKPLSLHHLGDIILFRKKLPADGENWIKMYAVEEKELGHMAFVNMRVHLMYQVMEVINKTIVVRV